MAVCKQFCYSIEKRKRVNKVIGILYIAHGSKKADKNQAVHSFVKAFEAQHPEFLHALGFLEAATPDPTAAGDSLIAQGVSEVIVVPLLLFSAMHAQEDIPQFMATLQQKYPDILFKQTATLGADPATIQVAANRAADSQMEVEHFLLFVHGSKSYPTPEMTVITQKLAEKLGKPVSYAFIYGEPQLISKVEQLMRSTSQIGIIPYFLFDGILVRKWQQELNARLPKLKIVWTHSLQLDEQLFTAIENNLQEVMRS